MLNTVLINKMLKNTEKEPHITLKLLRGIVVPQLTKQYADIFRNTTQPETPEEKLAMKQVEKEIEQGVEMDFDAIVEVVYDKESQKFDVEKMKQLYKEERKKEAEFAKQQQRDLLNGLQKEFENE